MRLSTKKLFILFLFLSSGWVFGQDDKENLYDFPQDDHYGIIKIGSNLTVPFGNNFAETAFGNDFGFDVEFTFNLFESGFLLGAHWGIITHDVKNRDKVGNYDNTTSYFIGPVAGYQFFPRKKLRFMITTGVGHIGYRNDINGNNFRDTGTTIWLSPEIDYHFNKHFGLYFSPTFQKDFLKIEAPQEVQDFFETANYLKLQLGIRVVI